jgi:putative transposase
MADLKETESTQTPTEVSVKGQAIDPKTKAPKAKPARSEARRPARTKSARPAPSAQVAASPAIRTARKIYSEKERAQKLGAIERLTGRGESVKNALKQVGISEQTYYQWKKAAGPIPHSGELKDLVALEEENARLKKVLADRLRKENAELKKKLGLD